MRILGIVILYYPDEKTKSNIESYSIYLDKLIVWNNTPQKGATDLFFSNHENIVPMGTEKNEGIGKPLNEAVKYAIQHNYTHLLTMDQDSSFLPEKFQTYLEVVKQNENSFIGLFSPGNNSPEGEHPYSIIEIERIITSGTIYKIHVFREVGLFRDDYFIDAIDAEFSLRVRRTKIQIVRIMDICMQHVLGNKIEKKVGFIKMQSLNYSPMRTFYIIRNHLITRLDYPEYKNIAYMMKLFVVKRFFAILFIESDKRAKLKALFRGLFCGLTKNMQSY